MMMNPITSSAAADASILAAVEKWKDLYRMRDALPDDLPPAAGKSESAEEAELWKQIDAEEQAICLEVANTPEGAMAQLRVSLAHGLQDRAHESAAIAGDLQRLLEVQEDLDWEHRMVVSAMRSLQSMNSPWSSMVGDTPIATARASTDVRNTFGFLAGHCEDVIALIDSILLQLEEMEKWTAEGGCGPDWVVNSRLATSWRLAHLARKECDHVRECCDKQAM